jgi:predicted glycogen debranching enzyme
MGKAVEINALWYNAQRIYAGLLMLNGEIEEAKVADAAASRTRESFLAGFWNAELDYCYDVIDGPGKDASVRPNAIFTISLPFALFEGDKAESILKLVKERLYTPIGLRTLDPADPRYKSNYTGDLTQRDNAYHQGTVWTWLLGPYVDAIMKIKGEYAIDEARTVTEAFKYHLSEAGIGTVSEIADAEPPFLPRGCIAQAWGVGEWLRVIRDYSL